MQRTTAIPTVLFAAALALPLTALAEEKLSHLDVSGGASQGHWVMLVSKAMVPKARLGTAVGAVGKSDKFEAGFGMSVKASRPTVAPVSEADLKAVRENDKDPRTTTTIIDVSPEQYKTIKAIVEKWAAVEEHVDGPINVAMNFGGEIFKALGFKMPYRSGANAIQYWEDAAVLNRNLAKKDS